MAPRTKGTCRWRCLLLTITATTAALLIPTSAAIADDTRCAGTLGPVVVDNLIVPTGSTCSLIGTQVRGNVRVEPKARLDASRATIAGSLECARVNPAVSSQHCLLRNETRLRGSVKLMPGATFATNDADIEDDVACDGCRRSDLNFGTTVGGDVQIKEAQEGSVNTGTFPGAPRLRVGGDVEFLDSRGGLTLFNTDVVGNLKAEGNSGFMAIGNATQPNTIGGDVQVSKNSFSFAVANSKTVGGDFQLFDNRGAFNFSLNRVRENLQSKENTPPPTGAGNTAAKREDQCAAL